MTLLCNAKPALQDTTSEHDACSSSRAPRTQTGRATTRGRAHAGQNDQPGVTPAGSFWSLSGTWHAA